MRPYPYIEFVLDVGTWQVVDDAYADTGFEGGIAIPVGAGREILAEPDYTPLRMPDGRVCSVPTWDGKVGLEDRFFNASVVAIGSHCLIGREIVDQLEICFEFGRQVRIRFQGE